VSGWVIVINGGSSSGKTSIVRELQQQLREPWLALGIDVFIGALPPRMTGDEAGIRVEDDGQVGIGSEFTRLETMWMTGIAAIARAGGNVIVDDGFLSGPPAQERWRKALDGVNVLWAGVHCDPGVAEERGRSRGDRPPGMARHQALAVHRGIRYDVEVDTTDTRAARAAQLIAQALEERKASA
jgi:chloramphenicol 3-O phosphotransferase